jgi:hypothetical protein
MSQLSKHIKTFSNSKTVIDPRLNFLRSLRELALFQSWRITRDYQVSRRTLTALANKYSNNKAVIVCNGPSLLKTDLERLANVYTIGLNKINLIFDYSDFKPTSIVAVNKYVIQQNIDFYQSTSIPLFLDQKASRMVGMHARANRTLLFSSMGFPGFSTDPRIAVNQGATVTYVALQLAYFLGFKSVALVGCDHSFDAKGADHQLVKSGEIDTNHFDKRYFAGGAPWQLPSISQSEESYLVAKRFYEYDNRSIYNCTVGGRLELFPRISLGRFLEN